MKRSQGRLGKLVVDIRRYRAIDYTQKAEGESECENQKNQDMKDGSLVKGEGTDLGQSEKEEELIQSKKEWGNECDPLRALGRS